MKKENGITLVALIVTIIILLVLATVSVQVLIGDHGLITKTETAKNETIKAEGLEKIQLAVVASYDNGSNINTQKLAKNLSGINGLTDTNDNKITDDTEITLPQKIKLNNIGYIITEYGAVERINEIYVTLYSDGLLSFSNNSNTDSSKTVLNTYVIKEEDIYDSQAMVPWNNETSIIQKVMIKERISPKSTKMWFSNCLNLTTIENIQFLNTSKVNDMSSMFYNCSSLLNIDLSKFNTNNVENMENMFRGCKEITSLDLRSFNTSNVTNMAHMFRNCRELINLDLSSFDTRNVLSMACMFCDCRELTNIDLSNFDTSNVTNMSGMFYSCIKITTLDLSNFDMRNVKNTREMFCGWDLIDNKILIMKLKTIYVGENWKLLSVTNSFNMFSNCNSIVGEKGTTYNSNNKDGTYARIDGGPKSSTPGYLTLKNI